jgi:putative ATP-dependent endonuclease of the OLD family
MHGEKGFEDLVLKNTTEDAIKRFVAEIELPPHLTAEYPNPQVNAKNVLSDYLSWSKGDHGIADFLGFCQENEIPQWIRDMCTKLKELCDPPEPVEDVVGNDEDKEIQDVADLV